MNRPDMDIKETIISSFFFHLILFLLLLAVSHYTTGLPGGMKNIVSVELLKESEYQPAARTGDADEQPAETSPPSDDAMILPEESIRRSEPEKKAEPAAEPPKVEKAENLSIQKPGFTSLEAYHQFILLHKKIFGQKAGARVNELLGEAFKTNKREFYGGTAVVSLKFGPDRRLNEVLVDSASPALKAFFEEIDWGSVPPPAAYSLGFNGVQIEFTVLEGSMSFKIDAL
jgi:hypothetical protein